MKYTITGATGHLGRKVVEQLSRLVDIQRYSSGSPYA